MLVMKDVFSSLVSRVGYDDETGELVVEYLKKGNTVRFQGVPPDIGADVVDAPSVGEALHNTIYGNYGTAP